MLVAVKINDKVNNYLIFTDEITYKKILIKYLLKEILKQ